MNGDDVQCLPREEKLTENLLPLPLPSDINQSGEIDVKDFEQAIEVRGVKQGARSRCKKRSVN